MGFVPSRTGSRLIGSTPNNLYPTGDGTYIHITAMADSLFRRLAEAMGQPELARDDRFARPARRNENHEALDEAIGRWTSARPLAEIEEALLAARVPATRIFTIADIFNDPHYRARKSIVTVPDEDLGSVAMAGVVPRLSATPGAVRHAGKHVGRDTRVVLRDVLGLADARIDALAQDGVIALAKRSIEPSPRKAAS
jgi:crotonobetainyl-CoA:carnitine CoA-transferase CaiB-like acyl-CoA transferase